MDRDHPAIRNAVAWLETVQNTRWWLGRGRRQLRDGLCRAEAGVEHSLADLLGVDGPDGRRTPRQRGGAARRRLPRGDAGRRRLLVGGQAHTATGFPRVFYLRYDGYPKFFPLQALSRYRNLKSGGALGLGM